MASAYAALVSVIHVLNRIQSASCPVMIFQDNAQIQSLPKKVCLLIDFLEENDTRRKSHQDDCLERRIANVACAAEDLIESFVVQQILAKPNCSRLIDYVPEAIREAAFIKKRMKKNEEMRRHEALRLFRQAYEIFCEDMQKTAQELDSIIDEVKKIRAGAPERGGLFRCSTLHVGALTSPSGKSTTMVGFDDELIRLMDMLTTDQPSRQIISIIGMGGAGKTTLAINVYKHPFIVSHFHVRAWVAISQHYSKREIILSLLREMNDANADEIGEVDHEILGGTLYKSLFGRKYLITLDDIWSVEPWNEIKRFFPDNRNGSRVMLTTRLSNEALSIGPCIPYQMRFLDDKQTWALLSNVVFGGEDCPPDLKMIGKRIGKSCGGLPLAIIVIGGLLKVSDKTRENWEDVAENIVTLVNTEMNGNCLNLLALSYNYLPIHLKPCFLYMSTFGEGSEIRVSRLIKLWVADGFLKPHTGKTLEQVAFECLKNLVDRNLVMFCKRRSTAKMKAIHDLLRDLSLREAQKECFLCVIKDDMLSHGHRALSERRFIVNHHSRGKKYDLNVLSSARSLIYNIDGASKKFNAGFMLRILGGSENYSLDDGLKLINSRYIELVHKSYLRKNSVSSSISLLWNLETIIVNQNHRVNTFTLPTEIWKLSHLRHLVIKRNVILPENVDSENSCVLENLQSLSRILNFGCNNKVIDLIPNLKKLTLHYHLESIPKDWSLTRCFNNLLRLQKLESLKFHFKYYSYYEECVFNELETLSFPSSLRHIFLSGCRIPWVNMSIIGSLPNLQILRLGFNAFCGQEWNTIEGEFQSLEYLSMYYSELVTWRADDSHFPRLQHLNLQYMNVLKEVPCNIGDISSLESIVLIDCSMSAILSAKRLHKKQESFGNADLLIQVIVHGYSEKEQLQSLANENFQIINRHKNIWMDSR